MSYQCPNCRSHNTMTYEMAYLSGSHSGYSTGTAIDDNGTTGIIGGHYSHSSHVARQTAPPELPIFGCGAMFGLLIGSMLVTTVFTAVIEEVFRTLNGLWSFPVFFVGGFILIERSRRRRMPQYHAQVDEWSRATLCCRCGYRWLRL